MIRRTIRRRAELAGVGLHYGRECRIAFLPAESGAGIRFRRTDLAGSPETPAHVDHAVLSERRTDRKSTRLNSSHVSESRMPSSA